MDEGITEMKLALMILGSTAATFAFFVWIAKWADSALSQNTKDYFRQLLLPTDNTRPARFVANFFDTVLTALMGTRVRSWKFFLRSAVCSCLFMSFFASIVWWKSGANSLNLWTFDGAPTVSGAAFIAAISIVCCIDYVSFAMTWFLLSLVAERQSALQIAVIGLADIVLTSNLFTFLFTLYLMCIAWIYINSAGQTMILAHVAPPADFRPEIQERTLKIYRSSSQDLTDANFRGGLMLKLTKPQEEDFGGIFVFGNVEPKILSREELGKGLSASLRNGGVSSIVSAANNGNLAIAVPEVVPIAPLDVFHLYSQAFVHTSAVRTQFWGVLAFEPGWVNVNRMIDDFDTQRRDVENKAEWYCFEGENYSRIFQAVKGDVAPCKQWLHMGGLARLARVAGRTQDERRVFLATTWFFWSSFAMTMIVYVAVACFAITRTGVWAFRAVVSKGYFDADKAVFHVLALPTALVFSVIIALALIVWFAISG